MAVVLALTAVATSSRSGLWWRLSTFTYQANLLAAAFYMWTLASTRAALGYTLLAVNRAVATTRIDAA
jgi:hypothetical protein